MVRKRSRTTSSRRNYKKLYESDENESESDLDLQSPPSSPAPKRYGLRQRKQPIFCEDFDYDDEDELNVNNHRSDDEEYNVEVDLIEANVTRNIKNYPRRNTARSSAVSFNTIEPEPEAEDSSMTDGLIDFEDVIRADVVVNKQKVDYDNVINKTEIQVQTYEDNCANYSKPIKEKGRRLRKPKAKLNETHTAASEGSGGSFLENSQEEHTNLEVQIDPLNFVQCDSEESNPPKSNGVQLEKLVSNETPVTLAAETAHMPIENGCSDIKSSAASGADDIDKFVPPVLDEKEKEVVLSNEYLLGNSFDMSADEFLEKQAQKQDEVEEEEEIVPFINFDDDSSSDDDVVIIEKKPEVIVLDDD